MFKNKFFILITTLVLSYTPLFSQDYVRINLQDRGLSQYQQIFIGDFDFLQLGSAEELFAIVLTLSNPTPIIDAQMTIELSRGSELLATIQTGDFIIPSLQQLNNQSLWIITNVDLINKDFDFNGASTSAIRVSESEINDQAEKLRDEIIETSQLPVGIYKLRATLSYNNAQTVANAETEIIINIRNPFLLNQVAPGTSLNSGFVYELYTQNPIFQWSGNSGQYQVVVFKKSSDFSSPDDILNSQPVWESVNDLNVLFARYPDDGAIPLEYGSEYAWQVRSFIQTSSGVNIIESELWEFKLLDPSTARTGEAMAKQELEILLKQLLGDRADAIIREIDQFGLSSIRVNGSLLTVPELYQIMEKYRDQEKEIYDLILRSSN